MDRLVGGIVIVVGIVHLLPLSGVLSAAQLERLYGVAIDDPSLVVLMRHRAVLFGLIGSLMVASAFIRSLRPASLAIGTISVVSFTAIARGAPATEAVARVVTIDWICAALLAVGIGAEWRRRR